MGLGSVRLRAGFPGDGRAFRLLRRQPLHAQVRLRRAARAHVDEGGDAFEDGGETTCVDVAFLVHQFGEYLRVAACVLQPLGGVVQQRFRVGIRVREVGGVAGDPGFAEDVHA
jgi:hypothetical protein